MTAKEKYLKDSRLGRLSKKEKEKILGYEPWLSLDSCAVSAVYQVFGFLESDILSPVLEEARRRAVLIYSDGRHIGTVVDMRGVSLDDIE